MGDFLLDYTASEINKKLGEIDNKLETVSWNDLTDKPFGIECESKLLFKTTGTSDANMDTGSYPTTLSQNTIQGMFVGERKYRIVFNGTEYILPLGCYHDGAYSYYSLGFNIKKIWASVVDIENKNIPFVIWINSDKLYEKVKDFNGDADGRIDWKDFELSLPDDCALNVLLYDSPSTDFTLEIYDDDNVSVKTLDKKYLPSDYEYVTTINRELSAEEFYSLPDGIYNFSIPYVIYDDTKTSDSNELSNYTIPIIGITQLQSGSDGMKFIACYCNGEIYATVLENLESVGNSVINIGKMLMNGGMTEQLETESQTVIGAINEVNNSTIMSLTFTLTDTNQTGYYQCDKTVEEICDAFNAGKTIIGTLPNKHEYICTYSTGTVPYFTCITGKKDELWYDTYDGNWKSTESMDSDSFETIEDNKNNFATEAYVDTSIIGHEISYNQLKDKPFYYDEYTVKDKTDTHIWSFPCSHEFILAIYANKSEGEEYRLVFDGDYYILDSFSTSMVIGNTSLLQNVSGFNDVERQDTGEPFCITYCGSSVFGVYYRMYTKEDGVHSFCIEIVKPTPYTKQLDEKFIPDTIARTDNLTILPIERLADFGGSAEIDSYGFVDLCVSASIQNPTNYLFKIEINDAPKGLKIRFVNSDGTKQLLSMIAKTNSSSLYHITNDTKNKCVTIYELYFGKVYELFYDDDGNFVSRTSTNNVTSYNVLDELNYKTKSDSYSPAADTDVATKKYVDDLSQSFILNSSTEGSSKRFQITVDDTGTITAKEITS